MSAYRISLSSPSLLPSLFKPDTFSLFGCRNPIWVEWCRGAVHKPVRRPVERGGLVNRAPTPVVAVSMTHHHVSRPWLAWRNNVPSSSNCGKHTSPTCTQQHLSIPLKRHHKIYAIPTTND